ncbi:macrophage mannose receptor 1 isoform X2 [Ctenopharyngodon idella]|uniref:macrophage mannose receptor 1 isoform X2 n=1 Tax=Ctenopharyngodon idella TaxID=7959 RepID=UPI00222F2BDE|nr:macrophage mannose receptor 1 isoform X2 [Ctenopharyngodon idella]
MVFFLLVIFGLLSFTSSQISHQYHFINIRKKWTEAQRFCRENYTDLATVNNAEEMNSLFRTISDVSYDVYIGLYRSEVFRWHWTLPDSSNVEPFQNWKDKQPDQNNNHGCAAMNNNGEWFSDSCDSKRPFVCFNAKGNKIPTEKKRTWRKAREYCRNNIHTDLANVRNISENDDIKNALKTIWNRPSKNITEKGKINKTVWIGLFKDAWLWSDQSNSSFRSFSQPKNISRYKSCTAVNKTGRWNYVRCNITLPFICHGDLKPQPTTKPGPLPTSTARQNPSTSIKSTPSGAKTTTEHTPAKNTTDGGNISSQPTQILTTEQAIPGPATTKQHTPAKTTELDNLILVRENLTWTEAVSYCRKHHVDLVSIHSEELQERAAGRAIQASTSHVWLGLRYTCTFNFWFWIKNREAGCYQNWASGHGHDYECGLSGAMESTGGHRWVGRPESERLNFICQLCADTL